jgi:hypothetical protein
MATQGRLLLAAVGRARSVTFLSMIHSEAEMENWILNDHHHH